MSQSDDLNDERQAPSDWVDRAHACIARGQTDAAEAPLRQAIALDGEHIEALELLGNLLSESNRALEGAELLCRAYLLKPAEQPPKMRGIAYYVLGRIADAADVYRRWLEREPENEIARHLHAACSGNDTPARASDGYIKATFDECAPTFDARAHQLGYHVPEQMTTRIARIASPQSQWNILDAGCGTGLLGPLIRPWARQLTGVDLSTGMLAHARQRGCYDLLIAGEMDDFLRNHAASFDLICFADTLIYFGQLAPVLAHAWASLKPGGYLLLNTEMMQSPAPTGFSLTPSGRFAHRHKYVDQCLADAGFTGVEFSEISVRVELCAAVKGELVLAQKAISAG